MQELVTYFHEFNIASVSLRLFMAMLAGAFIGVERGRRGNPAGLRTYMLVSIGSALTMLISMYDYQMIHGQWAELAVVYDISVDVSRYSAKVTSGIGFLAAGSILVNRRKRVKGVTSAASLWASACMGIAIGAGYYGCILIGFLMIHFINVFLFPVSGWVAAKSRDMSIYVEYDGFCNLKEVLEALHQTDVLIFDVDIDKGQKKSGKKSSAVISMRLPKKIDHGTVLKHLMRLPCVQEVNEV